MYEIRHDVDEDGHCGYPEHDPLHHGKVTTLDRQQQETPDAWNREDVFDNDRPCEDRGDLKAE